jgi:large subunit ribosomal protein LP0
MRSEPLPEGKEWDWYRQFGAPIPELDNFNQLLKGKVGFIFTDEPVFEMKPKIESNVVDAPARAGTIAPIDVTIYPGPTNMDPS